MTDYTVYINMTAPYASGKGRRTIWRGKARVDAVGPEEALRSQSFESVGKTVIHGENKAICILGAGWEVHLNSPGEKPHCKACGALKSVPSGFCRDCVPRPKTKGIAGDDLSDELAPRYEKVAQGKLRPLAESRKRRPGKRAKKKHLTQAEMPIDLDELVANMIDDF